MNLLLISWATIFESVGVHPAKTRLQCSLYAKRLFVPVVLEPRRLNSPHRKLKGIPHPHSDHAFYLKVTGGFLECPPLLIVLSCAAIALPLVSALKLSQPTNPHSNQTTDILWTVGAQDPPTWTLFLMNISQAFDLKDIVGEFIDPAPGKITVKFPVLRPRSLSDDYVLYAVNATNLDWVLASSGRFTIFA
ncbi:hypothetical protein FB451DRAFT_1175157 [Mycena latifolia]|nr:hypothetical protein FB451DRAFT_1175157 [Mycena latifolia]